MDWLIEPFRPEFMLRALLAAELAVITSALVGTWVVLRGLSFMGDALAHGVLPGIALAFALGFDLALGAVVAAAVMVLGINLVHRKAGLSEDTGIALLFVGMLALGVIIMSKTPSYTGRLTGFLFGDPLGITRSDLVLQGVVMVATVAAVLVFYRPFLVLAFNEEKAEVLGLRPGLANIVMLALLTGAIVASYKSVGNLLVFGLLVAPPAAASLLVRRVPTMIVTAIGLGSLAVVTGLLLSWHAATAAGPTMAGLSVALFFVVLGARRLSARAAEHRAAGNRSA